MQATVKGFEVTISQGPQAYNATVPAVPSCTAYADTHKEALANIPEEITEYLNTVRELNQGIADMKAGRTRPADEVFVDLRKKYNIPETD